MLRRGAAAPAGSRDRATTFRCHRLKLQEAAGGTRGTEAQIETEGRKPSAITSHRSMRRSWRWRGLRRMVGVAGSGRDRRA